MPAVRTRRAFSRGTPLGLFCNAIQADLIRWDDSRARFVLTGTGRNRITARSRTSGKILRFKMRDEKDGRAPLRKA
jgi:hypothetical protein